MMSYADTIADAIQETDSATVALVEELMRLDHSTLDHMSRPRFVLLAQQAYTDAIAWEYHGGIDGCTLRQFCESFGLDYPTTLRGTE